MRASLSNFFRGQLLIDHGRGGMFAPLLGGTLLSIDRAFPVYASIVVFCLAGIAVVLLKEDSSRTKEDGVHTALH